MEFGARSGRTAGSLSPRGRPWSTGAPRRPLVVDGQEEDEPLEGDALADPSLLAALASGGGSDRTRKLIPVIFADADPIAAIASPLRAFSCTVHEGEYEVLLWDILGSPAVVPAPVGAARLPGFSPGPLLSGGVDDVRMSPENALYQLLLSLFGADEFRRWIRFDTEASIIVNDLPGPTASASDLVGTVVDRLVEHGLVNRSFFVRLRDARPRRAAEIDRVAALWPSTTTGATPPT